MDLSKVGERIQSSVRSVRSLGLLPFVGLGQGRGGRRQKIWSWGREGVASGAFFFNSHF